MINIDKSHKIQVLRGIAILAVVLIHNTPGGIYQVWLRPFLNFSVGLFLFLSGMLSNVERYNPKRRLTKIIIPYIIWTLIYTARYNFKNPTRIPYLFLYNLFTANADAIMYYVFVYCEFTLLIPFIDKLAKSKYKWIGFIITPIEIVIMRLIPLVFGLNTFPFIETIKHISCLGWFTYFYLGYLIGNGYYIERTSTSKLLLYWIVSIVFQIIEGYWYFTMGDANCGTQLKLTAILSGVLFALLSVKYINSQESSTPKLLLYLGNNSFGIFFSHLAVMSVLKAIPFYNQFAIFPFNAIVTTIITILMIKIGKILLGKYSHYLAL